MPDCIFCKIIAGEIPSHKVYEDDRVLAFLDIRPLNPGHTLVVPKSHADTWLANGDEDAMATASVARKIAPAILRAVGADACNVTSNIGKAAGQVVFHTHFHIIPRHENDGYKSWHRIVDETSDPAVVAERIRVSLRGA
jgi:histidine triad (HIT) family protein